MNQLHKFLACLSCLLLLSAAGKSHAASPTELPTPVQIPPVLTLDEALRRFRAHGLDLLIADASVQSAQADVKVAGAVTNPTISGSVIKTFNYSASDPSTCPPGGGCSDTGWVIGLSDQALWDVATGKRGLRLKAGRAALQAIQLGRKDTERTLVFQVQQQFVQVALAQRALDFAHEVEHAAAQTADLNRKRYTAGAISEVDLSKAQTDYLEAQQALDNARANLRQGQVGLAFLLGARGPVPEFTVQIDLAQRKDESQKGPDARAGLIEQAMSQRPDLQAQAAQRSRAQAALQGAYRQRFPDGSFNVQYQQQGSGQNAIQPPTLMVGIQFSLPIFNLNQGGIRKSLADVSLQTAQYAKLQSQVVSDVESSYNALDLNRRLIQRLETGLLAQAKLTRDLQSLRYQKGAASLLEYLDAQRVYITSSQEYFQSLANYWTASFQLQQALGVIGEDGPTQDGSRSTTQLR